MKGSVLMVKVDCPVCGSTCVSVDCETLDTIACQCGEIFVYVAIDGEYMALTDEYISRVINAKGSGENE